MVLGNLIFQTEVVEQRFTAVVLPHHDQQASDDRNQTEHGRMLSSNMLLRNLILLIDVTFSTPTGVCAQNPVASVRAIFSPTMCNFVRSAAYCFMDAENNRAKGPQPHEGQQMEGLDLESVIERARGHDAEAKGEINRRYVRHVIGL